MYQDLKKIRELVGENPHQKATLYENEDVPACSLLRAEKVYGRDLSFNDTVDTDGALALIREFKKEEGVTVVTYHHGNPCGVAIGKNSYEAFTKAIKASDATSLIEGIVVVNDVVDVDIAKEIANMYLDVLVCINITNEALEILNKFEQLTIFKHPNMLNIPTAQKEVKTIMGGCLVQDYNDAVYEELNTISTRKASEEEMKQMLLAYRVVKHVKTNAIVLAKDDATTGIGPSLNNRIWSTMQAIERAGENAKGSVLASDAIIPLCESVEIAGKAGVTAIIQPGGWFKENENLEVSERYNMAMITTGINQFKH